MREIKFQIYWIAGHEMLYDTNNDLEFRDKENYWITDLSDATNHPESYKVRQYTGLKDKNDIEIYEGDIVLVNVFMSKHVTGLVAFDRGSFCVTGNFEGWGYDCNTTNFWEMSTNGNEYKVIGNIYENPELAK